MPVGDPNMVVEWFHNGQPLRDATRIKCVSDFGFVVMDLSYLQTEDSGLYVCRATNKYGSDETQAALSCVSRGGVLRDSLQPQSLQKIAELEQPPEQLQTPAAGVQEPPKFQTQIGDIAGMQEGHSAHFEARLTPVTDPDLVVSAAGPVAWCRWPPSYLCLAFIPGGWQPVKHSPNLKILLSRR